MFIWHDIPKGSKRKTKIIVNLKDIHFLDMEIIVYFLQLNDVEIIVGNHTDSMIIVELQKRKKFRSFAFDFIEIKTTNACHMQAIHNHSLHSLCSYCIQFTAIFIKCVSVLRTTFVGKLVSAVCTRSTPFRYVAFVHAAWRKKKKK